MFRPNGNSSKLEIAVAACSETLGHRVISVASPHCAAMCDSGVRCGPMDLRTNGFLNAQMSPSR